tara:strand:- start:65 stop:859 length:795 start_codon:yes stop_codon:yes gene_type:complete
MIVQHEFLNRLKDFGLNSYESKLWAALLSRGISTAGELSDIANVPRSRTYDVLESLEKKGFIIMKIGKPIKYIAVSPTEVLERVKRKLQDDAEKKAEVLDKLKDTEVLKELDLLHKNGIELVEPTDLSGFLKGTDNLYHHLEFSIKNAKESVVLISTETGIIKKADKLYSSLKQAKDSGVKIRIVAPSTKKNTDAIKKVKELSDFKEASDLSARACIVDNSQVIFMLSNNEEIHESYDTGVWVNSPFFCEAYSTMFEKTWKSLK